MASLSAGSRPKSLGELPKAPVLREAARGDGPTAPRQSGPSSACCTYSSRHCCGLEPARQRCLEQIAPISAGFATWAAAEIRNLPISPWTGIDLLAAWTAPGHAGPAASCRSVAILKARRRQCDQTAGGKRWSGGDVLTRSLIPRGLSVPAGNCARARVQPELTPRTSSLVTTGMYALSDLLLGQSDDHVLDTAVPVGRQRQRERQRGTSRFTHAASRIRRS
jgi:hypothetical protein